MRTWLPLLLFFICTACQFEEETTLSQLYAGEYAGTIEISLADTGKSIYIADSRVEMTVAGDDLLDLKFYDMVVGEHHIDQVVLRVRLSGDGTNRVAGQKESFIMAEGGQAVVEAYGTVRYDRSDLLVHMEVDDGELSQWVIRFAGTRKIAG